MMTQTHYECEKIDLDFFDHAPVRIASEVILPCSPQTLFNCFEDAGAWADWVDVIQKVEWTSPQPFEVGTTRNVHMPGGMIAYEEFIAWDAPRRMAFRFNQFSQGFLKAFGEDYQVTDLGDDSCRLVWTVGIEPRGPSWLVAPFLKLFLAGNLRKIAKKLKKYMENEGSRFRVAHGN